MPAPKPKQRQQPGVRVKRVGSIVNQSDQEGVKCKTLIKAAKATGSGDENPSLNGGKGGKPKSRNYNSHC